MEMDVSSRKEYTWLQNILSLLRKYSWVGESIVFSAISLVIE